MLYGRVASHPFLKSENPLEFEALIASIRDQAERAIKLNPQIPNEAIVMLRNIKSDTFLLSFIASNLGVGVSSKQAFLEVSSITELANKVHESIHSELQLLELKDQIETKVRGDIEKQQRDYFLSQQLKTIQEELGQNPQEEEIMELQQRAKKKDWPEAVAQAFDKEINKVKRMNPQVAEYSVTLNYLDLLLDLPWNTFTADNFDLRTVKTQLDKDHFGLEEVKDRILEHLAVLKLKGDMKAPILCLVGPPGVGKKLHLAAQ